MRGDDRIRTGGEGVADPCLTTWLRRHIKLNDPKGIRTPVTAVKGRCLNRLTMGPRSLFVPEAHIHETGKIKTPRVGLEPTTARLTAACSTD